MADLAGIFKALSDINRLRIMTALLRSGTELCICEIMDTINIAQYNVSRCVKELRVAGLIEERREGRFMFYSVVKPQTDVVKCLFKALKALTDDIFAEDHQRLTRRLSLREGNKCVIGMRGGKQ